MCSMKNIDMCLLYKSHLITRLVLHLINYFSKWMFIVQQENSTKSVTKITFYTFFYITKWFILAILLCIHA